MKTIVVGMADMNLCKGPDSLTTIGLGSCIGISLYDPTTKIAGMVHIMLPYSTQIKERSNRAKFADTGISDLFNTMIRCGASKATIVAKIAGGAHMFNFSTANDQLKIGQKNIIASKEVLKQLGIRLIAEDTGGNYGRTIELRGTDGSVLVKAIGKNSFEM